MGYEYEDAEAASENGRAPQHADAYVALVHGVITHVVAEPQEVEVTSAVRGRTIIVEISVAPDDMGKIIGKGGRNIDAIRALARAAGLRHHERVQVELLESDEDDEDAEDSSVS